MATVSLRRSFHVTRNLHSLLRSHRNFTILPRFSSHSASLDRAKPTLDFPNAGFDRTKLCAGYSYRNSRGFAKGRKSKVVDSDDDVDGGADVVADVGPSVKETAVSQMEAAKDALTRELNKLRTGRASAGMLDHIIVEINGAKMPLNRVAVVSVLDAKTLSVMPYDQNALKSLHTAIVTSPLGLNPTDDGQRLIAVIPPLTKENIQALCKVVSKHSEDVKQSIRRARQKALDSIKKAGSSIPKDSAKRLEKEVEEVTKRYVKSAEDICKAKEKEISGS